MTDPNAAFAQRLRAIFAEEAREQLARIDASLEVLAGADAAARPGLVDVVLKALHTLKGAARAVDLGDLERLCHALEGALVALRPVGVVPPAEQIDTVLQAVGMASQLIDKPTGQARNQAAALCGRLDALARQAAALVPAPPAPPAAAPVPAAPAFPEPGGHPDGDRVRVNGKSLDMIRIHAEALLPLELRLHHQVQVLAELAAAMARQRREGAAGLGNAADTGLELDAARLAAELGRTGAELGALRARLMDATLETGLVPFAAALEELPALVRNLVRGHGKQVQLETGGASVAIDRRLLGVIREALIHLVTNAVDHGIEPAEVRRAAGKPAEGLIKIALTQRDGRRLALRVVDDGAGMDADAVAAAAASRGAIELAQLAQLSEQQRLQLALRAGISTRAEVTPVSGRGMGLAIVAEKVAAAGGQLLIENVRGSGCAFELLLPVGIASLRALVVEAGGLRYALPLAGLETVRRLDGNDIRTVEGRETLLLGSSVVPLVRLAALCGSAAPPALGGIGLFARVGAQSFGVLVDAILAEQDVLPKPLGTLLRQVRYISGAAQLGDGALVPVVALDDIATHALAGGAPVPAGGAERVTGKRVLVVEDSATSRLLLKHILEGASCEVDTAVDGLDALSKLRGARYDAVVSDVEMPNLDGLGLTAAIRANAQTAELPVILVTSLQTPEQRAAGLRAGADAYFTKGSFDQDGLLATVRRVAGMERA